MRPLQLNGATRDEASSDVELRLLEYARMVSTIPTVRDVLDTLHEVITSSGLRLCVLGAARLPLKTTDWGAMRLGQSVFLHESVPDGWWDDYTALAPTRFTPTLFYARSSLASFTWAETKRMLEPIGMDRWSDELALKYGMRDIFTCPVGGRWMVAYWSKRDLANVLTPMLRILLQAASSCAAQRLEHLTGPDVRRVGSRARLTAREIAVLRLVATGRQASEMAEALGLGLETVRSHLKKAQTKLGARNRAQAACEALRQNLIP